MLGNTKSNNYRKTYDVEPIGAGGKSWHLTQGDLSNEHWREVSRRRSSDEVAVMVMERRAEESDTPNKNFEAKTKSYLKHHGAATEAATRMAKLGGVWRNQLPINM